MKNYMTLKSIDGAFGFIIEAVKQEAEFCKGEQEPEVQDKEYIEMMEYTLTDFHRSCKTNKIYANDNETPFVETAVPPLKALLKL